MHEMGIALEIHKVCREIVEENGGGHIHAVRMAIGELAAIEPDLLTFAWEAVVADGPDADAELKIEWCRARQHCSRCAEEKERSEGSWLRICPDCGLPLAVSGGDELDVLDVTIMSEEESAAGRDDVAQGIEGES